LIEDSPLWMSVFGFNKGTSGSAVATGKGKNNLKHCADIAVALFIDNVAGVLWTLDGIKVHQGIHHIMMHLLYRLHSTYADICGELGETGHGLVVLGCEDELIDGSPAANIYDVIKIKFPWYRLSNSKSAINLTVLDHDSLEDECEHTPLLLDDNDDPLRSPLASPPSLSVPITPIKHVITLLLKCHADTPTYAKSASKKHKSMHDMAREVADAEHEACLRMNETNAKEHTAREQIKRRSAHDTALAVERMRVEQAAAQREHELLMMEKQIELERIWAGIIDPQLH
ncbi:hypothetical protein M405DRAFT_834492, partial [Rhizopogon salebrosus TDB-379]